MPNDSAFGSISKVGCGCHEVNTHGVGIELEGCNLYAIERTVSRKSTGVILTVVESLDAVLANPIIFLSRTEERYGWDLEQYLC
jgi:hypothetical protein